MVCCLPRCFTARHPQYLVARQVNFDRAQARREAVAKERDAYYADIAATGTAPKA